MTPEALFLIWIMFAFAVLAFFAWRDMKKEQKKS